MNLQIIDPTQYPNWDDLILRHSDATIFHSSAWARVFSDTYGYTPAYFTVFDGNEISALLPVMEVKSRLTGTRGVSLPFTDYCDPITRGGYGFRELFESALQYGRRQGWGFLEIRGGGKYLPSDSPSARYLRHIVELGGNEEDAFYGFKATTRRNIRKASREGVETGIFDSLDAVKQFSRLNGLTRRDHGLPPQPFGFFERLHDYIISKGHGFVVLGSYRGEPVAGAVFLHVGRQAVYKYGASDRRDQNLRANNLVIWEGVKWCLQKGMETLCLGRTEPENEGLLRFKSGWTPRKEEIIYHRYDLRKDIFVSGHPRVTGFHNRIFRRMPVPILNRIGALLYKHIG